MQLLIYRISIITNDDRSLYTKELDDQYRYELIRKALGAQPEIVRKGTSYNIYNFVSTTDGVTGRIGRPDIIDVSRPTPDGKGLNDLKEDNTEWAHFIFAGVGEHYFIVQKKQAFFGGTVDGLSEIVESLVEKGLDDERYKISVKSLTDKYDFWKAVDSWDKIYTLNLIARVPNPLRGSDEFADIVEYNHTLFNAVEFESKIKNDKGNLTIPNGHKAISDQVEYVSQGGGEWQLEVGEENGEKLTLSSMNPEIVKSIKIEDPEKNVKNLANQMIEIVRRVRELLR